MAQDDVVNLDAYLEDIEESQLFQYPEAIADKPYSGARFGDSFKNFLVEDLGVPQNLIDIAVGRPGGFRERFYSPGRGMDPFGLPPMSPIQFRGFRELMEPTDPRTQMAREAGIKEDPPSQISRLAAFLPEDTYDTGVQKLIKQYYGENFDVPSKFNYEFQREPFDKQVIYRDPTDNELKFINPPGMDIGSFTAGLEPLIAEFAGGAAGAGVGAVTGVSPVLGGYTGEVLASFTWRLNNLNFLKDQGLLDESYDNSKILTTAMKDAGFTALFSLGGIGAFKALSKFLGNTKAIPGVNEEEFVTAFEALEESVKGTKGQKILETATVPEIMEAGSVGSPLIRRGLQAELVDAAAKGDVRAAAIADRLEKGSGAKERAVAETVEEAGEVMPTKGTVGEELTRLEPEQVIRKQELGLGMRGQFEETVDPKILEAERAIEEVRGSFDSQLGALLDDTVEPNVALDSLRQTVKDIQKGDRAVAGTGKSFKIKLNKILSDNKTEEKILDNVLDLAKTSDRQFFKSFLNDPEYVDSRVLLKKALKNKYKTMLQTDEAGNLIPMSRDTHNKFLTENKNLIEDLFDDADITAFRNAETWANQLNRQETQISRIISDLQREPWGKNTEPEFIFRNTWTREREGITKTQKVKDIIGENQELADEYRLLILNDMRKQTNGFREGLPKYIDDYGAMLDEWFPKEMSNNLRFLSNLIDDMKVNPGAKGGDDLSVEVLNKMARVYVGFFTAPGRALSAAKQLLGVYKNSKFIETLLNPRKYLKDIQQRKVFFNNPFVKEFARGMGRTYGRSTELVSGFTEPEEGQIETTSPVLIGEDLELNRGGEALMELKY